MGKQSKQIQDLLDLPEDVPQSLVQGSSEMLKDHPPETVDPHLKLEAEHYVVQPKLTADDDYAIPDPPSVFPHSKKSSRQFYHHCLNST